MALNYPWVYARSLAHYTMNKAMPPLLPAATLHSLQSSIPRMPFLGFETYLPHTSNTLKQEQGMMKLQLWKLL